MASGTLATANREQKQRPEACQAIVDIEPEMIGNSIAQQLDQLAASVYKLLNH